jgi:hypothetical protein
MLLWNLLERRCKQSQLKPRYKRYLSLG